MTVDPKKIINPFEIEAYGAPAQLGSFKSNAEKAIYESIIYQLDLKELLIEQGQCLYRKEEQEKQVISNSKQITQHIVHENKEKIETLIPNEPEQKQRLENIVEEFLEALKKAQMIYYAHAGRILRNFMKNLSYLGYSQNECETMSNIMENAVWSALNVSQPPAPNAPQPSLIQQAREKLKLIDQISMKMLEERRNMGMKIEAEMPGHLFKAVGALLERAQESLQQFSSPNTLPQPSPLQSVPVAKPWNGDETIPYVEVDSVQPLSALEDISALYDSARTYQKNIEHAQETLSRRVEYHGIDKTIQQHNKTPTPKPTPPLPNAT